MKKAALLILSVIILCTAHAARAAENELPVFASVRDMIDSTAGYYAEIRDRGDYTVAILEMDGRYIRMVTLLDDHAKELYRKVETEDFDTGAVKVYEEYAWALPLSYIGELSVPPLSQSELDGLKGKTVQELMEEGFGPDMLLSGDLQEAPSAICLERGFFRYEFEVTNGASGFPDLMTVTGGKPDGFSRAAFDIAGKE